MNIMQGDQYDLSFHLTIDNEEIDITQIEKIQFKVGDLLKEFIPSSEESEIVFDDTENLFNFPLTETETFKFNNTNVDCEVRIKFVGGVIKGLRISAVPIQFSSINKLMG